MKVLVTGARGFMGKNLISHLREHASAEVLTYVRGQDELALRDLLIQADTVVHLAGENRPAEIQAFDEVNVGLTKRLCQELRDLNKAIPVIFTSSIQAEFANPYGRSKLAAEEEMQALAIQNGNPVAIYRLPGVFGKWCRPNYNSVVATFCYNKVNDLPVQINDHNTRLQLAYVDDVVNTMVDQLHSGWSGLLNPVIGTQYSVTLGELAEQIDAFKNCRTSLISERVGSGFVRALYATYVSYMPVEKFAYSVPFYGDERGVFVEMLKTQDAGQFSYFTAHPGITRGGHYHHTKTEKFLVIKGHARFGFRHILTGELHYLETRGDKPQIVESVPGWTHDITNIGNDELIVMLWANEIFDRDNQDTYISKV